MTAVGSLTALASGRPTSAAAVPVALSAVLALLSTASGSALLAAASVAPLVLGLASVVCALGGVRHLGTTQVEVRGPSRAEVGDLLDHGVQVRLGAGAAAEVLVEVEQPGTSPWSLVLQTHGAPGEVRTRALRHALARGEASRATVTVGVADVLHLVRWRRRWVEDVPLLVRPARVVPAPVPPVTGATSEDGVLRPARGGDLAGVRAWRRGDRAADVHRRATARTGRPVVVVREEPVGRGCAVVLAGASGVADVDEARLALAAATGARARGLDPSAPVGVLLAPGRPHLAPGGRPSALLDWWARVDLDVPGPSAPRPRDVVAAAGGAPTVLVVGSPVLPAAWWDQLSTAAHTARTTVVRVP